MATIVQTKQSIKVYLIGGLVAGVLAAILNNLYSYVYTAFTGISVPGVINFGSVTGASILPAVIASLFYFALSRFTAKATLIFIISGIAFTLFSFGGPLQSQLPDNTPTPQGFAGLTLPMHIISGLVVMYTLVRYVNKSKQKTCINTRAP
jgi:ABC-type thiamin/hydroxymethylpyrimidine transport system permease subunit